MRPDLATYVQYVLVITSRSQLRFIILSFQLPLSVVVVLNRFLFFRNDVMKLMKKGGLSVVHRNIDRISLHRWYCCIKIKRKVCLRIALVAKSTAKVKAKYIMGDESLCNRLANPARPVFLLGDVPPGEGTPPGKCQQIADKFLHRSRVLASDGFIVYDIQDEPGRSDIERPFPFRRVMDSSTHAALLARSSGRECLVYKCVADPQFDEWLERARNEHGHSAINIVGRATSEGKYEGPTVAEAMDKVANADGVKFGCVCIAERHTLEAAEARGRSYPTEHLNMLRKSKAGADWFISQVSFCFLQEIS